MDDEEWSDNGDEFTESLWNDGGGLKSKHQSSDILISGLKETKKIDYKSLKPDDVREIFNKVIKEFGELLNDRPPYEDAKLILQYYDWNVDLARTKYFLGDQTDVRVNSGIEYESDVEMRSVDNMEVSELECPVCLDDVPCNKTSALTCGHRVCSDCWSQYIIHNSKAAACFRLTCPMSGCDVAATATRLLQIGVNPQHVNQLKKRSMKFRTKHFVNNHTELIECRGKDCLYTTQLLTDPEDLILEKKLDIKCLCGHVHCIACSADGHSPSLCEVAEKWLIKATSESENMQWILARTKKCTKCRVPIEKNQGCNHMTCRNCKHEFCWLCKGDWKDHGSATGGFYKCNIFEKKKKDNNLTDEEKARADAESELERYGFYFTRYDNHIRSISYMEKTLNEAESRIGELMSKYQWKPNEASFIKDAANTIIDCRRLLAWTYPIGYYMDPKFLQVELFHQYQKDLEQYTEKLHELTEQDLSVFADHEKRAEVINYQRVIKKYRTNLVEGIKTEINPNCKFNLD